MDLPVSARPEELRRLFDAGARLTKKQAGAALGVSPRQIERYVKRLRAAGVPVEQSPRLPEESADGEPRAVRYYLEARHQRRAFELGGLDEGALHALVVAVGAARGALAGTGYEAPLDRAFGRLLAAVNRVESAEGLFSFDPDEEEDRWHFGAAAVAPVEPEVFDAVSHALGRWRLRVDYQKGSGERSWSREVSPLGLAPVGGAWLLAAYCHERRAVRDFNVARLQNVRVQRAPAHVPGGFETAAHFAGRFGGALAGRGRPQEVRLHVSPERAVYFETKRYHPSQQTEREPGGALCVRYRVRTLDAVRAFVASWGPHVEALAPPELVERLREDAQATAALYGTGGAAR